MTTCVHTRARTHQCAHTLSEACSFRMIGRAKVSCHSVVESIFVILARRMITTQPAFDTRIHIICELSDAVSCEAWVSSHSTNAIKQ